MFPKVEFMLDMYDDIDWMDEPTETGWMPAPEQVKIVNLVNVVTLLLLLILLTILIVRYLFSCLIKNSSSGCISRAVP